MVNTQKMHHSVFLYIYIYIVMEVMVVRIGDCPVGWGCRIHWLHLCRGVRPPNECPGYDTKQSDGEVPAMLGPWNTEYPFIAIAPRSTLWSGRALSMG